jgi:hypothetical protein
MPEIRGFLTVSASHLPRIFAEGLMLRSSDPTRGVILAGHYGFFLFARGDHPDYPDNVQKLLAHAADLDCGFVLFDRDGDVLDGFAAYCDEEC